MEKRTDWASVNGAYIRYLESEGLSKQTIRTRKSNLKMLRDLAPSPADVTTKTLTDFLASKGWKKSTAQTFTGTTALFYDFLIREKLATANPVRELCKGEKKPTIEEYFSSCEQVAVKTLLFGVYMWRLNPNIFRLWEEAARKSASLSFRLDNNTRRRAHTLAECLHSCP